MMINIDLGCQHARPDCYSRLNRATKSIGAILLTRRLDPFSGRDISQ